MLIRIGGQELMLLNVGPKVDLNPSISFTIYLDAQAPGAEQRARALWEKLGADGEVRVPLDAYPETTLYGWVEDRFGVNWQIMLTVDDAGTSVLFGIGQLADMPLSLMDGGRDHQFDFGMGSGFAVRADTQAEVDRVWEALSTDPEAEMRGWLRDEFGIGWNVIPPR